MFDARFVRDIFLCETKKYNDLMCCLGIAFDHFDFEGTLFCPVELAAGGGWSVRKVAGASPIWP